MIIRGREMGMLFYVQKYMQGDKLAMQVDGENEWLAGGV